MNFLAVKVITHFVRRLAFLGLALFLSAGSWGFWQAWMLLAVFFIGELPTIIHLLTKDTDLLKRRLKVGPSAEKRTPQKIIMSLSRLCLIAMVLVAGFDHRLNWSRVPAFLVIAANGVVLLGFLIIFIVFKENSFASATIEIADQQKVIATGPYAVVRHPMYLGVFLVNIFMPIALGSWWGWPFSLALVVLFNLRILDEEKLLGRDLPGYEEYCRNVKYRLIPGLW
jgi:protein-S-isoprenylcysteine O-methyltransferase Ste14